MPRRNTLKKLVGLKSKTVIGLNSGTSADGIDAAIVRITGEGFTGKVDYICGETYRFSPGVRERILRYAEPDFIDGVKWLELDADLAVLFANACGRIAKKAGLDLARVDLIGSHGQTIRHLPGSARGPITYQIADPARIASLTGITTIGDFRIADTAAGGQGAPLTPIVNAILFGNRYKTVGVLNIGGIANLTVLNYSRGEFSLFGCDTGPGNMVIDQLVRILYGKPFDRNGRIGREGKTDEAIVKEILRKRFFKIGGPKSTGREQFGKRFAEEFVARCKRRGLRKADIIATASYLTVAAIARCIEVNKVRISELILAGGGTKNKFIKDHLKIMFENVKIKNASDYGYPEDYLEAISFAVLANEAICSRRYDLQKVTGSQKPVVPGKICQA